MSEFKKLFDENSHLPFYLKDFHDAKDFFKTFHEWASEADKPWPNLPNWIDCHVFTVDYLLRFLAVHGYTLQKWRKRDIKFYDIMQTIRLYKERLADQFDKLLSRNRQE